MEENIVLYNQIALSFGVAEQILMERDRNDENIGTGGWI